MMRCAFSLLSACLLFSFAPCALAADAGEELKELVGKIKTKVAAGQKTEEALADELKSFDTLLAGHTGEKTDAVAQILYMKGVLYTQVFQKDDVAIALFKRTQAEFPETEPGKRVPQVLAMLEHRTAAKVIRDRLAAGTPFPDFTEADLAGKPLSIAQQKGKVVLVDFWATWCKPCVAEMPNVLSAYAKFHDKGFEIVGISLDEEKDRLNSYIEEQKMPWPQYFDGKRWENKLAMTYGITGIPASYLLDKEGKIIAADLRGQALQTAIEKALQ